MIMKIASTFHLFVLLALQLTGAAEVPPPDGGPCWSNTFQILQNQIATIANPASNLTVERKYVFCEDMVYKIGALNPDTGTLPDAVAGEQWPVLVFIPNVHFHCPGNCTMEMVAETNVFFAPTTQLVTLSGLIPQEITAPPSNIDNLIIDGFTIKNAGGVIYEDASGVVTLGSPGQGIIIRNCIFDTVGLAGWAIASEYYAAEAAIQPDAVTPYYQTVTILDCVFMSSAFDRSAIISFAVDAPPPVNNTASNFLRLERLTFVDNSNTGETFGGGWKGLITTEDIADVTAKDLCFINSATPTGSLMEIRTRSDSIIMTGIYESGSSVILDSKQEEECLGGIILNEKFCFPTDATACPMMDDGAEPTSDPTAAPTMDPMETNDPTAAPTMDPMETNAPTPLSAGTVRGSFTVVLAAMGLVAALL